MSGLENSASILPDYIDTKGLKKELDAKRMLFATNADILSSDAAQRIGLKISGASAQVDQAKRNMQSVIDWLRYHNEAMKRAMEASSGDSSDFSQVFNAKKREVEALRKRVHEAREIESIRQEQVKSLELREEGNYHTSWMGLARPLKQGSQVGLSVAAGAFAIMAIAGVFYVYKLRQEMVPDSGFFRGGHRKGRYSS